MDKLAVVILAAGQGTRMKSSLPKVLHRLGGKPLVEHVHDCARQLAAHDIHIVYGHGGDLLRGRLAHLAAQWVLQAEQKGTGHAVEQAMPGIGDDELVLVLYGDVPLVRQETLHALIEAARRAGFGLLTAQLADPAGYGRIVRDGAGRVQRIVEQKDATADELALREINTGMLAVGARRLRGWLRALENDNAQGEFYLTDVIAMAVREGIEVETVAPASPDEILGVNNRAQLAELERFYQRRQAERLMLGGVTLRDPARLDVRGEVLAAPDVEIDVNVVLEGRVVLGSGVRIGPNCVLRDCEIGEDAVIKANSVIEEARVGPRSQIGPFARVRPETVLAEEVHIGNFVEIKKSEIGAGSKVNHLSYIGDSSIGRGVNVGAGTITCNYDGANKHRTIIEDNAFIGSDTQLVAPVRVGAGATIGAGTTLTRDAPDNELTLSRAPQKTISGWQRPVKKSRQ